MEKLLALLYDLVQHKPDPIEGTGVTRQGHAHLYSRVVVLFQVNLRNANGKWSYWGKNRKQRGWEFREKKVTCWSGCFKREELSLCCMCTLATYWLIVIIPQTCDRKQRINRFALNSSQFHVITKQQRSKHMRFILFGLQCTKQILHMKVIGFLPLFGCEGRDPVRGGLRT